MNNTYNFTNINNIDLSVLENEITQTHNFTDWDIINTYCTNLNNTLVRVMVVYFILFLVLEINFYLYKKGKPNFYKIIRSHYLNSQYFLYIYFIYIFLSNMDVLKYILQYRGFIISILLGFTGWYLYKQRPEVFK